MTSMSACSFRERQAEMDVIGILVVVGLAAFAMYVDMRWGMGKR
jgi:hypothetical protein